MPVPPKIGTNIHVPTDQQTQAKRGSMSSISRPSLHHSNAAISTIPTMRPTCCLVNMPSMARRAWRRKSIRTCRASGTCCRARPSSACAAPGSDARTDSAGPAASSAGSAAACSRASAVSSATRRGGSRSSWMQSMTYSAMLCCGLRGGPWAPKTASTPDIGPEKTTSPRESRIMSSKCSKMQVEGWWIEARTDTEPAPQSRRMDSTTCSAMVESSPVVGSSHSSSLGPPSSSRAMQKRFRSPPETSLRAVSATPSRRSWPSSSETRVAALRLPSPSISSARNRSDCRVVIAPITTSSCSTKPMLRRSSAANGLPSKRTTPL
mmetsp:Transcript_107549/g.304045  ORF Transcript_107549/g.304045 Transcript_107549/m.304045 type:complete len:322 (-) Transcript_107549:228-1193(-)